MILSLVEAIDCLGSKLCMKKTDKMGVASKKAKGHRWTEEIHSSVLCENMENCRPTPCILLLDTWIWIFSHHFTQLASLIKVLTPPVLSIADLRNRKALTPVFKMTTS